MKKVILNAPILGIKNEILVSETGRYLTDENGQQYPETIQIKFGRIALDVIIRSGTETDEQALLLFALSEKLQANLDVAEPTEMELTDEEFEWVKRAIDSQAVIVKARFLKMVQEANA